MAFDLTESQRLMASECYALLTPRGRTLREAVEFYVAHLDAAERSVGLDNLVSEVVTAKERDKFTPAYIAPFQSRLRRFAAAHLDMLASDFTPAAIDGWLHDKVENPTTRNNYRRDLRTMFAYALTSASSC